ncbi:MAG: hypothetical protein MSC48_06365 [Spirochaetia bacterium]|nr:hypothetical protein [Spirochaetia bacterium]
MKKTFAGVMVAGLFVASMIGVASCASNNVDPTLNVNVDDEVKVSVIDWTDRTLGEVAAPQWLRNMRRGNSDTFKQSWGVDSNRVIKVSMATGKTEATAQALSRAGFAYTQAAELNQKVIGRVGQGLNDIGQLEAVYAAASETKADMTGLREETGFYQRIRVTEKATKETTEKYVYYTVYSMDKSTWDNLCKKYLMDLMGTEGLETATQKKIGALFSEMKDDADKKDAKKAAEEKALYDAQMARLEAERAKANAETAKANLESKKLDAKEAQVKAAAEEAMELEAFLM